MNANIMNYVENKETSEFYPTPENLVDKMIGKVDWRFVRTVLEPSAGKGDIIRGIVKRKWSGYNNSMPEIDYIEIDGNLRSIIKYNFNGTARAELEQKKEKLTNGRLIRIIDGKYSHYNWDGCSSKWSPLSENEQREFRNLDYEISKYYNLENVRAVHDDFLTYTAYKQYDLIIMNPPFSNGDIHLLKALEMQKHGGKVVCLLNAETLNNPYTETRKALVALLNQYNADIEYIDNAFQDAERKANVNVALITVDIPKSDLSNDTSIFEKLAKAKEYKEPTAEEVTDLEVTDFIKSIVNRYRIEIESGIELIHTYERMKPYIKSDFSTDGYSGSLLELITSRNKPATVNGYVKAVRLKYWRELFTNPKFVGKLTSTLQSDYRDKVESFSDYDFSEFNIRTLLIEINAQVKEGIESEIVKMYDTLTDKHAYYEECANNRHYYDGWKTNTAWKIVKKVILPCYMFDKLWGKFDVYKAYGRLSDIERILNFFDGNMRADVNLMNQIERNFQNGITKNIECKYFNVTFYKKGTVHIVFTCPELIDRYNIYVGKTRNWLPPSYGKKKYSDLDFEEKAVVDSFQTETEYNKVVANASYYLASPTASANLAALTNFSEQTV